MKKIILEITENESKKYLPIFECMIDDINDFSRKDIELKFYEIGEMPFESLPNEIKLDVKETLKAYDRVTVRHANGRFFTEVGCCLKAKYAVDEFTSAEFKASEIYTPEERRENFKECFGYYPAFRF